MAENIAGNFILFFYYMYKEILDRLPYKNSFRFVDHISSLDVNGVIGDYTLKKDAFFYEDHFPDNPVTPGVIITEIMIQTGLVVLGIYLSLHATNDAVAQSDEPVFPLLTSSQVSFYKMVLPGEKVNVISKKNYFRSGKLKCSVEMFNETNELVAVGIFSGIMMNAGLKNKPA